MSTTTLEDSAPKVPGAPALRTRLDSWARLLAHPRAVSILLVIVVLLGAWFRFHGLDWDSGRHLHPDERFLSTTTNDLKWPDNLSTYFDPNSSTLSPYALPNMGLFVYGTLPVYLVKWLSILINQNNYDNLTLVGRALSGLFDIAAVLILFLIGRKLYGRVVGLVAASLLALSVLNIQLSHFYAVDTYANLFIVATMYFLISATMTGRWLDFALGGIMLGLGLASKISVFTLAVPILVGVGIDYYRRSRDNDPRAALEQSLVRLVTLVVLAMLTFRVLQPIAFAGPGFWNWTFNPRWITDIVKQQNTVNGLDDLPWVQQWTNRSMAFPLYNIVVWGLGLPLGVASIAGYVLVVYELIRKKKLEHLLPVVYVTATFIYHAATFIKFMRYFLPLYPFLVLFAAYLLVWLWQRAHVASAALADAPMALENPPQPSEEAPVRPSLWSRVRSRLRLSRGLALGIGILVVGGTLLYAMAFSTIYSRTNTRVAASRWIFQHVPAGSVLANEHWDDWLPIGGLDGKTSYGTGGLYHSVEMANYDDDTPAKLDKTVNNLANADYIILSSARLSASIPRLPMRYPMMTRYYQLLFAGKLGYQRVAEFTSYPTLFGIQIPDESAEEAFSVYDHPVVQIFKKSPNFDANTVRHELGDGINWQAVVHLTPLQASQAPNGLMLSSALEAQYQQAATWSSAEVSAGNLGSRVPVLAWFIVLELIGLFAVPPTLIAFKSLADRGFAFAKAVGLLIVAWGAWLLASLRIAPFTWWAILIVLLLLAIGSALLLMRRWAQLMRFLQARWQLLLIEELLFWIFFAGLLAIRMHNPDLWHPAMGGEKPMDLAYLTAIVRTPYFPSYDPWFAGGYINYYYFGMVLVATLIHLTGMVPTTAYNLAEPTFFALTALGGFCVALSLAQLLKADGRPAEGRHLLGVSTTVLLAGVCGALFVTMIGNLAQLKLLAEAILNLSTLPAAGSSVLGIVARFTDGLSHWLGGEKLPIRIEWWYWNATRVIPPAQGEAGPINEMPFFTFLFADLHAHALALPYTLLTLGLSLNVVRGAWRQHVQPSLRAWWRDAEEIAVLALLALTIGALWPMNTWDFPTYTLIAAAALAVREYARRRRVDWAGAWAVARRLAVVVAGGWLLFLPFHQNYASAYFGAELWKGSRTPLWAYLLIHGFFLFVLTSWMVIELIYGRGHNAIVRSLQLNLRYWKRRRRVQYLFGLLARPARYFSLAVNLSHLAVGIVIAIFVLDPVVGLALALALLAAFLLFSRRPNATRQFLLCMIGLGLLLTALVEVVVLKGDISRMNTVFKFYLQVWVLWAVASAGVLPQLASRFKLERRRKVVKPKFEVPEGSAWTPEVAAQYAALQQAPRAPGARRWWWAFGLLLAACLLYPITAIPHRMSDRFQNSTSVTLDGTAYMRTSVYPDDGRPVVLEYDREAMDWLRQNVQGMPTIVEANTPLYRWGSRISIYTGLPTVIGWDWHQKQQRSVLPGQLIDQRLADVKTIYNTTDINQALQLLQQYHVSYIYVGQLERLYYDPNGLQKFATPNAAWSIVYQNAQVQIYQVH